MFILFIFTFIIISSQFMFSFRGNVMITLYALAMDLSSDVYKVNL